MDSTAAYSLEHLQFKAGGWLSHGPKCASCSVNDEVNCILYCSFTQLFHRFITNSCTKNNSNIKENNFGNMISIIKCL